MTLVEIAIIAGLVIAAVVGVLWVVRAVFIFGPDFWLAKDPGGDASRGLAIWAEPVAFPGLRWGVRTAAAGLRRAGFAGEFRFYSWHARWRGLLVLPALMARGLIERQAQTLADLIADRRRRRPDAPIYLLGYSCGGFVALRALELLPEGVSVDSAALLSSAFDPRRDLTGALEHVENKLVIGASLMDWSVCGLGTLIFGGGDRVFTPTIGMLGVLGPCRGHPKLAEVHWRPRLLARGLLGMHEWCLPARSIADLVAPAMQIAPSDTT